MTMRNLRGTVTFWFDNFLHVIVIFVTLVFLPIFLIQDGLKANDFPIQNVVGLTIGLLIGAWTLHGLININRLTREKGLHGRQNRKLIEEQLREIYKGFVFHSLDTKITGYRTWTPKTTGKEISVYFDNEDLLINIKTFLRYGDMESPYHVLANQQETKELINKLEQTIKNGTQQNV